MRWAFWRRSTEPPAALPTARATETWSGGEVRRGASAGERPDGAAPALSRWSGAEPAGSAHGSAPLVDLTTAELRDDDGTVGQVPTQVAPLLRALHAGDLATADRLCAELAVAGTGPAIAAQVALCGVLAMHLVDEDPDGDEGSGLGDDELPGGGSASALARGRELAVEGAASLAQLAPAATPADVDLVAVFSAGAAFGDEVAARLEAADPVLLARVAAVLLLVDLGTGPLDGLVAEVEAVYGVP